MSITLSENLKTQCMDLWPLIASCLIISIFSDDIIGYQIIYFQDFFFYLYKIIIAVQTLQTVYTVTFVC